MKTNTMFKSLLFKILISCFVCLALSVLSGVSVANQVVDWYSTINKPTWNPPSYVFAPVWTILYILIGIAGARIWHFGEGALRKQALLLFIIQLILNYSWTPIFFGLHNISLSLVVILTLVFLIILTIRLFMKIDRPAAYLLIPYLIWVTFASYLNYSIFMLN